MTNLVPVRMYLRVCALFSISLAACLTSDDQELTSQCENEQTRTIRCGSNGENTQYQVCRNYRWEDEGHCLDIAECERGETREVLCGPQNEGVILQVCNDRNRWTPENQERVSFCENAEDLEECLCVLPKTCTGQHTDRRACGINERGTKTRTCAEGLWSDFSACSDPDECKDDAQQTRECFGQEGQFGTLVQTRACEKGHWSSYGACADPAECYDGEETWRVCGDDGRGVVHKQCVDGWWADVDEGACYQTADGLLRGAQSVSLYFDDSAYLSAWGDNRRGALGVREGDPEWGKTHLTAPTEVGVPAPAALEVDWNPVLAWRFGAARSHQCSIDASKKLWCWGRNDAGQLALPADQDDIVHPPTQISLPEDEEVTFVAVAEQSTCAVGNEHRLYCWGDNTHGQLGVEDIEQTHIPQLVEDNLAGYKIGGLWMSGAHGCMLDAVGLPSLHCWGDNRQGQTHDSERAKIVPHEFAPGGLTSVPFFMPPNMPGGNHSAISNEEFQDFVMTPDNLYYVNMATVYFGFEEGDGSLHTSYRIQVNGLGSNLKGQLGEAYSDQESQGVRILDVVGSNRDGEPLLKFYAGGDTVCAYAKSYDEPAPRFLCQGENNAGQIGDPSIASFDTFQDLTEDVDPNREGVASAVVGDDFLCVLLEETHRIRCRGNNDYGQLGDGTTTSRAYSDYVLHRTEAP